MMHVPISTCVFTREPTTSASGLAHVGNEDRGGSVYVGYIQTYCWICRYIYIYNLLFHCALCVSPSLIDCIFCENVNVCDFKCICQIKVRPPAETKNDSQDVKPHIMFGSLIRILCAIAAGLSARGQDRKDIS